MPEYYDYVLGLIPLALFGVSGLLSLGGFGRTAAVSAGGLLAVALVGHALFVNAPTDGSGDASVPDGRRVSEGPAPASD